jgi:uncharacterized protein YcbX
MATKERVGSVVRLWRFPVKSMTGEQPAQIDLEPRGVAGDRAYALIDVDTGKVASAKSVRLFPGLLECAAAFLTPPSPGQAPPPVRIALPSGVVVTSDSGDTDRLLTEHFGRRVTLARVAPEDFTIDQYHPDVADADPRGHRDTVVEQKLGSAFFAEAGLPSPVTTGSFFDLFPVSVLTTSTLDRLRELAPDTTFDERRFRMNAIIEAEASGFVENDWVGQELTIGGEARINIAMPDPRCVMTTLGQADVPQDLDVLKTMTRHNRLSIENAGQFPCAGVYGVVGASGSVRVGDDVVISGKAHR